MNLGSFSFSRCPKAFYSPNLVEPPCLLGGNASIQKKLPCGIPCWSHDDGPFVQPVKATVIFQSLTALHTVSPMERSDAIIPVL